MPMTQTDMSRRTYPLMAGDVVMVSLKGGCKVRAEIIQPLFTAGVSPSKGRGRGPLYGVEVRFLDDVRGLTSCNWVYTWQVRSFVSKSQDFWDGDGFHDGHYGFGSGGW